MATAWASVAPLQGRGHKNFSNQSGLSRRLKRRAIVGKPIQASGEEDEKFGKESLQQAMKIWNFSYNRLILSI
jgi:hypothetical protein